MDLVKLGVGLDVVYLSNETFKIFKSWVNALERREREREGRDINKRDYTVYDCMKG